MLGEVFYWLFNMSIAATVTGGCVLLIRRIRRIPRRVMMILWAIPLIRMCIPVGLGGRYGLMSLISKFATKTVVVYEFNESPFYNPQLTMMNTITAVDSYFPIEYKTDLLEDVFRISSAVWIIIAAALIIAFGIVYGITLRELRDSEYLRDNVWLSDKISSPSVYGIISPRIIIPTEYWEKDLHFVCLHEGVHIKRGDNLWRMIAFAAVSVHWFNPFLWIFLKCFLTDMELACDEAVISKCGEDSRKDYAMTLVNYAESCNLFASAFGGAKIRVRIDGILSYKRISVLSGFSFAALVLIIAYILLTNAG